MHSVDPRNLDSRLETLRKKSAESIPAHLAAALQTAIDHLAQQGIGSSAPGNGDRAPNFVLPDARGVSVALGERLRKGPVVLSFYRGSWCPYCNEELAALQASLTEIQALGASLIAVSPQWRDVSMTRDEVETMEFDILTDPGNHVSRSYGLVFTVSQEMQQIYRELGVDLAKENGTLGCELPVPGTFVIDPSGTIVLSYANPDYTRRLNTLEVLACLLEMKDRSQRPG